MSSSFECGKYDEHQIQKKRKVSSDITMALLFRRENPLTCSAEMLLSARLGHSVSTSSRNKMAGTVRPAILLAVLDRA